MNTKKIQAKRAANAAKLPNDIVKLVEQSVAERPELTPVERVHTELLDPLELEIVSLTPSQIVSRTTASDPSVRLTAVQVAAAYIKTATIAQVLVCLTFHFCQSEAISHCHLRLNRSSGAYRQTALRKACLRQR